MTNHPGDHGIDSGAEGHPGQHGGPALTDLFERAVRATPAAPAVRYGDEVLDYAGLNARANRLAHLLRRMGVGPGCVVAVMMERSIELSVALWGVLKAGAAYLPLDPDHPAQRIGFMLRDAASPVVLTQRRFSTRLIGIEAATVEVDADEAYFDAMPATDPAGVTGDGHLAYVLYTSGSTGQPKGCMIGHRAIVNRLQWMQRAYPIGAGDRVLQKTAYTFDVSVWEFFWPHLVGAELVHARPGGHKDSRYLADLIDDARITVCHFVPAMLRLFLATLEPGRCGSLRHLFVSGEALPYPVMTDCLHRLPATRLHNLYGPTEAAVDVTAWECAARDDGKVPIGRPIDNLRILIVGPDLRPVPAGEQGEICISGVGLADGYLNRPDLTRAAFVAPPPETGESRMYRTGDLGRWLDDGLIEYCGRADGQVKLRGQRIELGEIEARILEHPRVAAAAVTVQERDSADPRLVAYVVPRAAVGAPDLAELRRFLAQTLPAAMLPNHAMTLPALPVGAHGKVDRQALPWPLPESEATPPVAPASASEPTPPALPQPAVETGQVRAFVRTVLGEALPGSSLDDDADLFDQGATSLTLALLAERVRSAYGCTLPIDALLDRPTVRAIAALIGEADAVASGPCAAAVAPPPQFAPQAADAGVALPLVGFAEAAYWPPAHATGLQRSPLPLRRFGGLLGALETFQHEGRACCHYASSGGLNGVQVYAWIAEGGVQGVPAGAYYYHPEQHRLFALEAGGPTHDAFAPAARAAIDGCQFVLLMVAEFAAIAPLYQEASAPLALLEAGYMEQALRRRIVRERLAVSAVHCAGFDDLRARLGLGDSHYYLHSLAVGAAAATRPDATQHAAIDRSGREALWDAGALQRGIDAPRIASSEDKQAFYARKPHLRRFPAGRAGLELPSADRSWRRLYPLRASVRHYDGGPVTLKQLASALHMLAPSADGAWAYHRNAPGEPLDAWIFVRPGGVEGLGAGLYLLRPGGTLSLVRSHDEALADALEMGYSPGNRKTFRRACASLFLTARRSGPAAVADVDGRCRVYLEAGAIGQALLERQAEFGLGICPIGGVIEGKLRPALGWDDDVLVVHSFLLGARARPLPAEYQRLTADGTARGGALAVVGMDLRVPGADDLAGFWALLEQGEPRIGPPSAERAAVCGDVEGVFFPAIDRFDHLLFHVAPAEARSMDPQERALLESAWTCFEDAGYRCDRLEAGLGRLAVYVGAMWEDYLALGTGTWREDGRLQAASTLAACANRLSFFFDATGPSLTVNSACSSTLTALHLAAGALHAGDADAALVGGVNLVCDRYHPALLRELGLLSPTGRARPFGQQADGWVLGEGVGTLLLRPLERAAADGDRIHVVIESTVLAHTGRTSRYTAPAPQVQARALQDVLARAGHAADAVNYVEAAAPGASLADAAEYQAISAVFGPACRAGSVKGLVGHLEGASFLPQLARVLLQMRHRRLVAPAAVAAPSALVAGGEGPVLVREPCPWAPPEPGMPLRAVICANGATGSGGAVLVREPPTLPPRAATDLATPMLAVLSAPSAAQLSALLDRLRAALDIDPPPCLLDIAWTLCTGRVEHAHRIAFQVRSTAELTQALDRARAGEACPHRASPAQPASEPGDWGETARAWLAGSGSLDALAAALRAHAPRRVGLPTLPFAGSRHWLQAGGDLLSAGHGADGPPAAPPDRDEASIAYLRGLFARVSELDPALIEPTAELARYGINSLMIAGLNAALEQDLGPGLSKALFYEHTTLAGVAAQIAARVGTRSGAAAASGPVVAGAGARPDSASGAVPHSRHDEAPVAVIGMAGRYPMASDLQQFWDNLVAGRDCIAPLPASRRALFASAFGNAATAAWEAALAPIWGGFLEGAENFDPLYFGISPRSAELMDPQARLFLETAWEAFEDAGYNREAIRGVLGRDVGVFVGVMYGEYQLYPQGTEAPTALRGQASHGSIAHQVSYHFDLHGPSLAVDTMCSASLTAVHLALAALARGECRAAIAGGVNLSVHPAKFAVQQALGMRASDGRCRSFGRGGDGFVASEGVGAVLLKPFEAACVDGDHVYGLLCGSSANAGGRTHGYTVPNPNAHAALATAALARAGIASSEVGYVEAHGTGTSLGDPIEIAGLTRAFGGADGGGRQSPCAIGSVKSNIGHCESAAGIAGLTKVLLQLHHGTLAPSLHADETNPNIDFSATPFVVQRTCTPWPEPPAGAMPRTALVLSFGAGGANACVVVRTAQATRPSAALPHGPLLVALSADSPVQLRTAAQRLRTAIDRQGLGDDDLPAIAWTLRHGREVRPHRLGLRAGSMGELCAGLERAIAGAATPAEPDAEMVRWIEHGLFGEEEVQWDGPPRRIRLPGTPFAHAPYWVDTVPAVPVHAAPPLLLRNVSSRLGFALAAELDPGAFYLRDHQVQGRSVLPGVVQLECAASAAVAYMGDAGGQLGTDYIIELSGVAWLRPVAVDEAGASLRVCMQTDARGGPDAPWRYRVEAADASGTTYSQGAARLTSAVRAPVIAVDALAGGDHGATYDAADIYACYERLGVRYGSSMRGIRTLRRATSAEGRRYVLAELEVAALAPQDGFLLHPAQLDAALQCAIGLAMGGDGDGALALPFAIERLRAFAPLPPRALVWLREAAAANGQMRLDVDVCRPDGQVCIEVRGFTSRLAARSPAPAHADLPAEDGRLHELVPAWAQAGAPCGSSPARAPDRCLLVASAQAGAPAPTGAALRLPAESLDTADIAAAIGDASSEPFDRIVWGLDAPAEASSFGPGLAARQQHAVVQGLRLVQALLAAGYGARRLALHVLTRQTQRVLATEPVRCADAGVWGLLDAVAREYPQWCVRLVDIGETDDATETMRALAADTATSPPQRLARRGPHWYRQVLVPATFVAGGALPYRDGGVYIVVGGAGGIGEAWTAHVLRRCRAQVVWLGRRAPDAALAARLQRLARLGPAPEYMQVDAADPAALRAARDAVVARHGAVHGVVHAAIVLDDAAVGNLTEARLAACLRAKLDVGAALASAFAGDALDLVLFFSSVQAMIAAPGQSNYAAACAAKHALAAQLQQAWPHTAVKVIHWGYWGATGAVASSAHRARMRSLGIASIGESDGMAALDRLLCSAGTEAVAFKTVDDALPPDARAELACVVLPAPRAPRETPPAFAAARAVLSPAVAAEDPAHEALLASRLLARLCALLPGPSKGASFTREALGIAARHSDWFDESLRVLHAHGLVDGETGTLREVPDATALQAEWARLVGKTASEPAQRSQLGLIERMLDALPAILRGERLATEVMFPNAGMDAVQDIYRGTALSDYYNDVLATAVVELIEARLRVDPNHRFRLLEVGAGTGGTSAVLLERLRPHAASIERYAYTDLSRAFLLHAEREFAPRHPYLETALLDIERSPAEQGIDFGSFDVVVATNVLHATRDIQKTLRHAKAALRPGGWLCINEISRNTLFAHLTFGLLDGWWLARDRELRMPGSPALSPASWTHVLGACGYAPVAFPAEHAHGLGQQVIVARSDGVLFQPSQDVPAAAAEPPAPPAPVAAPPVIDETPRMSQPTRDYVSSILRDSLAEALKLPPERVQDEKAFADYGVDSIIAVSLVNLINTAAGITLPTTALFDHPSIARLAKHILDAHSPRPAAAPPAAAVAAQRCVAVGAAVRTEAVPAADIAPTPSTSGRYHRVTVRRPGTIDDLVLEEAPIPALAADEVRVAVRAFSLNFADLLCAKGLYPNQPAYPFTPGFDVAGVVVALGADVPMIAPGVVVGSEVVVATGPILGGHANLVTCKAVQATPKPPQLDFAQACALPTVVLTVIDAFRKAGLRQGERILIQSAAGGVGWAAMQIATHLGARIYATAGSAEKLEFLRRNGAVAAIDYLQQDFEQEIMRLTEGQGVDVVLNTLPGDALDRGLRCLAEGGRYVELAMTALKSARAVDLSVLADNQSFHSVDLRRLGMRRPERIREYWDEMLQLVDAGVIDPQLHHQVPFPEFREAYRLLEQRRNLGKVVVTIPPAWQLDAADRGTVPVRETAVAVIGMSGRFAGSEDLDAFWHHIANGHDLVTHARRWTLPTHGPDGRPWCDQGSFLDAVESFDPVFFNISGVEARFMDPQQRLCLEECWYALEDAGYAGEALSASACGVYAGYSGSDYGQLFADVPHLPAQAFWGNSGSVLASRISYFLDLHGPALAIDTACSSALVAVHLACQALRDREVDMALACSMFVQATPGFHRSANNAGMLSPTGRCHTFAAGADGFVPGEGGGAIVLRRLSDALQARDSVRAVIKGSGVNQDGATNGITAPSALSQARLQRQVYDTYGIDAGDIQLVEAHGTGTVLGDPIEIQALCRAFAVDTDRAGFSAIGSVKTNIGHTANSAGLAGLLKLLLALRHRQLPPSLHFDAPNPAIDFAVTPFYVNTALAPWTPAPGKPRTCAISAFGFSGTNAHLVLMEPPAAAPRRACGEPQLLALSAESMAQLRELVQRFVAAARTDPSLSLDDVSLTLLQGRRHCRHRLAVVAATMEEALAEFSRWLEGGDACVRRDDASADTPQPALAEAVVAAAVARGDERRAALLALARRHVARATIDFAPLFRGRACGRVPLPRYPFARKRYWVDTADTAPAAGPAASAGTVDASRLHPLVHRALPRFDGVSFESRFDGSEPWFAEHRVQGRPLLPGTAYVEMARFAFTATGDDDFVPVAVTQVEWLRPLEGTPRMQPVRIDLQAQSAGHAQFSIHDGAAPYCRGGIAPGDGEARGIDLPALRGRCGLAVVEGDALYAALAAAGVDYGPSFRAVRRVLIGATEALAEIELPAGAGDRALALHPMLLDAALHAAAPLMARRSPSAGAMLACGVDRIDVYAHCGDTAWAWIREPGGGNGLRRLDVDVCDAHGSVCARIRGYTLRPLDDAALTAAHGAQGDAGTAAAEPGAHLLAPAWCVLDAQPDADPAPAPLSLAIGAAADLPAAAQAAALRIDWNDAGDADGLVARCLPLGIGRVVLAPPTLAGIEGEALVEAARTVLLRGFALLRAFATSPFAERTLQWCVHTRGAWAVTPDESPDPLHAALSGLLAVAARENAGWRVATLDAGVGAPWPAMPALFGQAGEAQALVHRDGVWLRREMLPFEQVRPAEHPYRQDGVYVVVGGAGGIGEQWSRALIAGYRARLVWIGRRPADAGIAAKIVAMPAGPEPLYLQADVADRDALRRAIGEARRRYGAIHGVVHSAVGPLDDAIAHMDAHTFGRNLAAKLDGIVNLVDAVAGEPLDFLLCFSSTASFSTEHGKCAYVASSLFADAHALRCGRRLPFPVKVMNWGWWGGVGVANAVSAAHRVRADRMGIAALGAEDGMRALAELLCGPLPQLAALKLSPARAAALAALPRVTVARPTGATVPLALHESPGLDARAAVDPAVRAAGAAVERLQARLLLAILVETGALRDGVLRPEVVAAGYRDWLAASAPLLEGAGLLVREHGRLRRLDDAASTALWQQWREEQAAWASHPGLAAQLPLVEAALRALAAVLAGTVRATDVLFPGGSMAQVEGIYKHNPLADFFNRELAELVGRHAERCLAAGGRPLRILEIGAGTGGCSAHVFARLQACGGVAEYRYTDVSPAFLQHAARHYAAICPALQTALFDIERPPAEQGIETGAYDLVIACNVLHATRDVRHTLANAKACLATGGALLMIEIGATTLFNHLTFGLLEGWWRFDDGQRRMPGGPALSPAGWAQQLGACGFARIEFPLQRFHYMGQQLIAAVSDGVSIGAAAARAPALQAPAAAAGAPTAVAAAAAAGTVGEIVARALQLPLEDIDPDESLDAYGLDSILVAQIARELRHHYPQATSTLLFECRTLAALAARLGPPPSAAPSSAEPEPVAGALANGAQVVHALPAPADVQVRHPVASRTDGRVAVIGLVGRYPRAADLHQFWDNLQAGRECFGDVPADRWPLEGFFEADPERAVLAGRSYCRTGGFIDGFAEFDAAFFRITPREAVNIDPQERLFLQTCWEAIEDAGYTRAELNRDGGRVGVYAGVTKNDYNLYGPELWAQGRDVHPHTSFSSVANRVSHFFDFRGPSMPVDTMCSASLTAVHLACRDLADDACDVAIAGGVNLYLHRTSYAALCALRMLSTDGHCRSFGAGGDGFIPGEGVGAAVLKPLADAERDGDRILAVVIGSAINHGGHTRGFTVPNPSAQADVVYQAIRRAGIDPRTLGCIEAHGTGTALGDPIEVHGLDEALRRAARDRGVEIATQSCALGSVKSNLGHAESAAGIAGFSKLVLQLHHGLLAPTLHAAEPNPEIDFTRTPLRLVQSAAAWPRPRLEVDGEAREFPRRGGVSSFGAGGANAHVVLEEYIEPADPAASRSLAPLPALVPLSAGSAAQLRRYAEAWRAALAAGRYRDADLPRMAWTAQIGREPMRHRLAIAAHGIAGLDAALASFLAGAPSDGLHVGECEPRRGPLAALAGDGDLQRAIVRWSADGHHDKLLALWVEGFAFDWRLLHGARPPRRIGLPTYPFERVRHWLPVCDPAPRAPGGGDPMDEVLRALRDGTLTVEQAAAALDDCD